MLGSAVLLLPGVMMLLLLAVAAVGLCSASVGRGGRGGGLTRGAGGLLSAGARSARCGGGGRGEVGARGGRLTRRACICRGRWSGSSCRGRSLTAT